MIPVTVSGNEITDALRALGVQGDGRAADSSFGIWRAATNLCTNGGAETNLTNISNGAGGTGTVTRDTTIAKFGTCSFKAVTDGTGQFQGFRHANISWTSGDTLTGSAWVRGTAGDLGRIVLFDGTTNLAAAFTIAQTGVWQRVSVSGAAAATSAAGILYIDTGARLEAVTWNIDGVQVEKNPIATPYVHTDGATATRAAAQVQGSASYIDETAGFFAARIRVGWGSGDSVGNPTLFTWRDDNNNRLTVVWVAGVWRILRFQAGAGAAADSAAQTFSPGSTHTIIASWSATQVKISVNGGAFVAVGNTSIPVLAATLFEIGTFIGVNQADSDVLWSVFGAVTLSDADAAALHANGDADPSVAPSGSLVWPAATTALRAPVAISDTGATISDTRAATTIRLLSDTGVAFSTSLVTKRTRLLATTGVTISDALISASNRFTRPISDTGVTFSGSLAAQKIRPRSLSDIGATVSDSAGGVFVPGPPTIVGTDLYSDGTAVTFGTFTPVLEPLSVFMDVFEPYAPPPDETESYYADLPFVEAERKFAETRPLPGSRRRVTCSWHGRVVDEARGARVIVREDSPLASLIGERVRIAAQRGQGGQAVTGFVYAAAELDPRDDMSVTRRMFMDLGVLGLDRIEVTVETLS